MRILGLVCAMVCCGTVMAEPFLAVENGFQCSQCHVNPTGGGMRNEFGNVFSQTQLPAAPGDASWTGTVFERFGVGGNARAAARAFDLDDQDDSLDFEVDRVTLFLSARLNEHVSAYLDQQVAPGGSRNREAWLKLEHEAWYLRAGRMFLPYGLRLEDDDAFIRRATGINFDNPDNGIEVGYAGGPISAQLSVTNGTAGAAEVDDGKQTSLRISHVMPGWRFGVSGGFNDMDVGERTLYGVFGGWRTGPVSWLAEYDRIEDDDFPSGDQEQDVALLQASIRVRQGHYLHVRGELNSFDDSALEDRFRYSVVYDYFPLPFTELRAGFRQLDSDDEVPALNAEEFFVQGHVFF